MIFNPISQRFDFNGSEVIWANKVATAANERPVTITVNDTDVTISRTGSEFVAKAAINGELKFVYNAVGLTVILEMMQEIKAAQTA